MTSAQAASTHGFPAAWPCAAGPSRALGRWTQPTLPVTTSRKMFAASSRQVELLRERSDGFRQRSNGQV